MATKGTTPEGLPKRDKEQGRRDIEAQRKREERPGWSVGGGQRTRDDGVVVNGDGSPDGWQTGGR
jgi:hypothetical protein